MGEVEVEAVKRHRTLSIEARFQEVGIASNCVAHLVEVYPLIPAAPDDSEGQGETALSLRHRMLLPSDYGSGWMDRAP